MPMGRAAPAEGHKEEGEALAVQPPSLNPGSRLSPRPAEGPLWSPAGKSRSEPIPWPCFSWCLEGHGLLNTELRQWLQIQSLDLLSGPALRLLQHITGPVVKTRQNKQREGEKGQLRL